MNRNRDAKTMVVKLLSNWVKWTRDDLVRVEADAREKYSKIRRIAAKKVRNPLLRWVLKIFDKWLHLIVRRLEKKMRELKGEIKRIEEAIDALQNNNPEPAIDILGERILIFSSPTLNDIGLGDFPSATDYSAVVFYTNLVHDLREQSRPALARWREGKK